MERKSIVKWGLAIAVGAAALKAGSETYKCLWMIDGKCSDIVQDKVADDYHKRLKKQVGTMPQTNEAAHNDIDNKQSQIQVESVKTSTGQATCIRIGKYQTGNGQTVYNAALHFAKTENARTVYVYDKAYNPIGPYPGIIGTYYPGTLVCNKKLE